MLRGYEAGRWGGGTLSNPTVSNGLVTAGTWASIKPVLRNDQNKRDDDITAIGWNNKFKMAMAGRQSAIFRIEGQSRRVDPETYAGTIGTLATQCALPPTTTDARVFLWPRTTPIRTSSSLLDSGGWGQDGYIKFPKVTDELKSMR